MQHLKHHGSSGYSEQNVPQAGVGFVMQSLHTGRKGMTVQRRVVGDRDGTAVGRTVGKTVGTEVG